MTKQSFSNLTSERDFNMIKNSKFTSICAVVIATLLISFFGTLANAQNIPATKIAVDNRLVGSNSAVAVDINRQVNAMRAQMQAELATKENALAAEEESLKGQSSIMPQDAYNQRVEAFQAKVVEYRRDVQTKSRQLEIAIQNANDAVTRELKPIYQSVLQTTGATVLMDKTTILEQVPGLDVTTMVIEQLDLKLPSVLVVLPPVPEATPAAVAPATN